MKSFIIPGVLLLVISACNLTAQWVQVSNGLPINDGVVSLAASGDNIFAGPEHIQTIGGRGVYLTTNNGASWTQTSLINQLLVYALAVNGNYVFAGTFFGVYLSTDNGISWAQSSLNNQNVYSLAVNGSNVFAGTGNQTYNGVFLSTNNGISWTQTSLTNSDVRSLAVNGNNVFAGTSYPGGVYLSTNNGTNWTQTSLNNRKFFALAVNGSNVFAGTDSNGVYRSTNNGTSWTQTSLNIQNIRAFAISGNNIFAGTWGNGVYVSNDNGTNWTQRNEGLGNAQVWSLCILNNYIFAGKFQGGVSRRLLGELIGIKPISSEIPNEILLSQNYPNPFNPATTIRFAIPSNVKSEMSNVKLIIYDALGREIATLVNEQLYPGKYEVEWPAPTGNASNYPSGVYFYKLVAGDYSDTKKMLMVK